MSFGTTIVALAVIAVMFMLIRGNQKAAISKNTDTAGDPASPSPRELEMETELAEMRERLKVLERIATDDHETTRLSSQIDKLRDE